MSVCFHLLILDTMFTPWTEQELLHLRDKLPETVHTEGSKLWHQSIQRYLQNRGTSYSKRENPPLPPPLPHPPSTLPKFKFSFFLSRQYEQYQCFTVYMKAKTGEHRHEQSTTDLLSTIYPSDQWGTRTLTQSKLFFFFKWSRRLAAAKLRRHYY